MNDSLGLFRSIGRSQVSALLATLVDYGTLLLAVELFGWFYPLGVASGAALGAIVNFRLNRTWTFGSEGMWTNEAQRYALVAIGSLGWNVALVWLVTEEAALPYYQSKVAVAILVGLLWNYPLHRYWVFLGSKEDAETETSH